MHQGLCCFQGAQNSSACSLGRNKAYYCATVHNNALFNIDMHQDKHIIHVLMIHFAKLSLHLSAFLSLSFLPERLFSRLSSVFSANWSHWGKLYALLLVGTSPVSPATTHLGLICVLCVYICVCACVCVRAQEKERAGDLQSVNVSMSGCLGGCACEAAKCFKLGKECRNDH